MKGKYLRNILNPGDVVTTRDKTEYKVYIELEGLYFENTRVPKEFLLFVEYDRMDHTVNPWKDITMIRRPRTKAIIKRPKKDLRKI